MPTTLHLTPSETVTVRSATPDALEVEALYGPGGSPPPKHLHPAQDEHFEVLDGELRVRVGGEERTLAAGETLDIPRETVHQMWNPGERPARVVWRTSPAGRTLDWFHELDALQREGKVDGKGAPRPLPAAVLLNEYRDVFRFVAGPAPVVSGALTVLAAIGRARGHKPRR